MPSDFPPYPSSPVPRPLSRVEPARLSGFRGTVALLVGCAAAVLLGGGFAYLAVMRPTVSGPETASAPPPSDPLPSAVPAFAITLPRTHSADQARLADDEKVIGVAAGARHRAYWLRALMYLPTVHVVNDLLAGSPVSVTHCDRTGCTRVFTGEERGRPLPLVFGGWEAGQLLLRAEDRTYSQSTLRPLQRPDRPFPYPELSFQETTWKAWREAHPDTDVYLGPDSPFTHGR